MLALLIRYLSATHDKLPLCRRWLMHTKVAENSPERFLRGALVLFQRYHEQLFRSKVGQVLFDERAVAAHRKADS